MAQLHSFDTITIWVYHFIHFVGSTCGYVQVSNYVSVYLKIVKYPKVLPTTTVGWKPNIMWKAKLPIGYSYWLYCLLYVKVIPYNVNGERKKNYYVQTKIVITCTWRSFALFGQSFILLNFFCAYLVSW